MSVRDQLLSEIEVFLERHDMPPTAFGKRAMNDPAFVKRLRAGADVRSETVDRIRSFMTSQKSLSRQSSRSGNAVAA